MNIFCEEKTIPFSGVDQSDALTIASTFDFFQEAAINHAEILGAGRDLLKQSGQGWILSRLSVFINRRPRYGEKILVRTWPRGSQKLFAIRDYDIHYSDDVPDSDAGPGSSALVRGRSAWLIVDLEKRRPLRPQLVTEKLPDNEGINALSETNPESNDPPPSLTAASVVSGKEPNQSVPRRASYSDIDYYGHVNNARYIQWIQDLMEPEILEKAKQIRLDINYLSEVRHGDIINLFISPFPDSKTNTADSPATAFATEGLRYSNCKDCCDPAPVFRAELRAWMSPLST